MTLGYLALQTGELEYPQLRSLASLEHGSSIESLSSQSSFRVSKDLRNWMLRFPNVLSEQGSGNWLGLDWEIRPIPSQPKLSDGQWVFEHYDELAFKYGDRWIAVQGGKVVASGENAAATITAAREACGTNRILLTRLNPHAWKESLTW